MANTMTFLFLQRFEFNSQEIILKTPLDNYTSINESMSVVN
jgi:hypothetical protein